MTGELCAQHGALAASAALARATFHLSGSVLLPCALDMGSGLTLRKRVCCAMPMLSRSSPLLQSPLSATTVSVSQKPSNSEAQRCLQLWTPESLNPVSPGPKPYTGNP
eukprot:257463-Chlamydomonas_euryale.AAC.2